jgi:hypothetical protein
MQLLIDEDVPAAVAELLGQRGHDIVRVVDVLVPGTPDPAVAQYANLHERIVVTFNLRDYNRLIRRAPHPGHDKHPGAGLIGFQCPHPQGRERLAAHAENIEHEHQVLNRERRADRRLIVQITDTLLKIVR